MTGRCLGEQREGYLSIPEGGVVNEVHPPSSAGVKNLIEKIEEISTTHIDQVLYEAGNLFKDVCGDCKSMKDVMLNLHHKALTDQRFGEKYVLVLGQVSNYVVDNLPVRSELLSLIENDFKMKETMFESDTDRFINSVMLLGNVYNVVKIRGVPLKVLAGPMLEYLNLLLEGGEEHHKTFVIQIMLNGEKIFGTESLGSKVESLKQNMRKALITRELSGKSKCWFLLAFDYISNDLKPLDEELGNFYVENLGDDCVHVLRMLKNPGPGDSESEKCGASGGGYTPESDDVFKDIENLTIPPEEEAAASPRLRPLRIHGLPSLGPRLRNINEEEEAQEAQEAQEERTSNPTGAKEPHPVGDHADDDDMYGIQIEGHRFRRTPGRRSS